MADSDIINSGRNEAGQFVSKQAIQAAAQRLVASANESTDKAEGKLTKLQAAYQALKKQSQAVFQSQSKGWEKLQKQYVKSFAQQSKAVERFYKNIEKMRRADTRAQTKAFRQQLRAAVAARRGGKGGRGFLGFGSKGGIGVGGGISLPGIGPLLGIGAIVAVVRKAMSASSSLLSAEINQRGSVAALRRATAGTNVAPSKAAELLTGYQGLGKAQFFSGPQQLQGLIRLQAELAKGMGLEKATELVTDLTKSYGDATDRLNAFLQAAGSGNIRHVLEQFASGQNIVETTKALNALSIAADASKGKLDPMVAANLKITETMDNLNTKVEELITTLTTKLLPTIEKIANAIQGIDATTLALLAGGVIAAPMLLRGAGALGAGSLLTGGVKLAGKGIGAGAAALGSNPIVAAVAAATAASLAVDELGMNNGVPWDTVKGNQRRAGNKGYGAISWYLESRSRDNADIAEGNRLAAEARKRGATAKTDLDRLRAQRDELRGQIGAIPHAMGGGYSDENKRQLDSLTDQLQRVIDAINAANKATEQTQPKAKSLWGSIVGGTKDAYGWLNKYAAKLQTLRVKQLQEKAAREQQDKLNVDVSSAQTDLRRSELELARLNPFGESWGMMQSMNEFNSLQQSIANEITKLQKYLADIDQSTEQGKIEAAKTTKQIVDLQKESKANMLQLLQGIKGGYLDAIDASAMGAGKFEKFLITKDRNLGRGLREGMVKENPLVGTLNPDEARQAPFRYTTDMSANIKGINELLKYIAARLAAQNPGLMAPLPPQAQDALSGKALGPQGMKPPEADKPTDKGSSSTSTSSVTLPGNKLRQAGELLIAYADDEERSNRSSRNNRRANV